MNNKEENKQLSSKQLRPHFIKRGTKITIGEKLVYTISGEVFSTKQPVTTTKVESMYVVLSDGSVHWFMPR